MGQINGIPVHISPQISLIQSKKYLDEEFEGNGLLILHWLDAPWVMLNLFLPLQVPLYSVEGVGMP